jgi:predicted DNA-binding ribbon-helix-helix protein
MRSQIVKRSFVIAGQKKSISLEEVIWRSLKEIATNRDVTLLDLLTNIASTEYQRNLSSAIRLFVLNFYRSNLNFDIYRGLYRQYFAVLSKHCTKLEALRGRADQRHNRV